MRPNPSMQFVRTLLPFILSFLTSFSAISQKPKSYNAAEIQQLLNKLNVLGTVLYVAAHPDDENTRLISYFANEGLYRTAYLSATRGDGGQNLIGPEIRESLGIIRTQELLAARRIDGGQQFFSRANDFGYSKHPDETLSIWEKDKVLSDFVRVFRQFRPDIVVTRFNEVPGTTHGHHTTSTILAREAFKLSGDPAAYTEQNLEAWTPKKLFWNTSWWFYRRTGQEFDTTGLYAVDIGAYNSLLGQSYTEMAAASRSMHKSQGFGSTGSRGSEIEYLKQWEGEGTSEIFGNIETSWRRVVDSEQVAYFLKEAQQNFDPRHPTQTIPRLFSAREELLKLPDQFWKEIKLREISEAIRALAGIYIELVADDYAYVAGDSISLKLEAINRSKVPFAMTGIRIDQFDENIALNVKLDENRKHEAEYRFTLPDNVPVSHPYWLNAQSSIGMYSVEDTNLIGKPENDPTLSAIATLQLEGQYLEYELPVVYKRNDPVEGEVYRPVEIMPEAAVNLDSKVLVFGENSGKEVVARVIAGKSGTQGQVSLVAPDGWKIQPEFYHFSSQQKYQEQLFTFEVSPPRGQEIGHLNARLKLADGGELGASRVVIEYDHIPTQVLHPISKVDLVKVDLKRSGDLIGYIPGAGDDIPNNLRGVGYEVDILEKDDIVPANLKRFDAVILGVRAFNTVDWLSYKNQVLFEYVKEGGTMIVQYNTSHRLVTKDVAPYKLQLSRDRVTVEEAEIRVVDKKHSILSYPNKISSKDFDGWVQERGLYFPNKWDIVFKPILSANDPGESAKDGGLLIASYGKGYYIYTGYSWFRQLPAGVPGAYRIFANMIGIGKDKNEKQIK